MPGTLDHQTATSDLIELIPDEKHALALHKKYGSNERVVKHCQASSRLSKILSTAANAHGNRVDEKTVTTSALLHDIGRSRIQTVAHGYVGAEILEKEGVDSVVVEIVRRHVGAGISKEEARALGFPAGEYIPATLEQKIVCFSDKMLDGENARPFKEEVKRFVRKGHDMDRLRKLKDDVSAAVGIDAEALLLRKHV
jgi:uncharacterized protein (TIGR00295 family)